MIQKDFFDSIDPERTSLLDKTQPGPDDKLALKIARKCDDTYATRGAGRKMAGRDFGSSATFLPPPPRGVTRERKPRQESLHV